MKFPIEEKFELTEKFLDKYKHTKPNFGFNGLGEFVYLRCVDINTPVLCGDLSWKKAGELVEGDRLIAFTEYPVTKNKERVVCKSEVTRNVIEDAHCLGVVLDSGETLYCTPEHKWLAKTAFGFEWVMARDLKSGINGASIYLPKWVDVIEKDESYESGYLAGAFDGEASIDRTSGLHFVQAENKMLEKVEEFLEKLNIIYEKSPKTSYISKTSFKSGKPMFSVKIYGKEQLMKFFNKVHTERLSKKYYDAITSGKTTLRTSVHSKVVDVIDAGIRKIAVLSTSSATHITAGYPSHNTYSRLKESDGKNEAWWETVKRVVEGIYTIQKQHIEDYKLGWNQMKAQKSAQEMYDRIFNFKMLGSGRALWAMGTPLIMEKGLTESLYNCSYVSSKNISDNPGLLFAKAMDFLMCGIGVGSDVSGAESVTIKEQKKKENLFVIPDSREGWVESLQLLINSFFGGDKYVFDYSLIRPAGEPIKTFGGTSSGHKALKELHEKIQDIYESNTGKLISARVIADTMNLIGKTVIAGNVRRSAEIIFGDATDEFLDLKDYEKNPERMDFGWASNNSVYAKVGMDYSEIAKRIVKQAEPGLYWLENARKYGRIRDDESDYRDSRVSGANPCFSYDSMLLTEKGYIQIGSLDGKGVRIVDSRGITQNGKVFMSGTKRTITLTLSNGKSITCTPNHVFANENLSEGVQAIHSLGFTLKSYQGESPRVVSIAEGKYEPVYDFSLPEHHWGVVNGVIAHNCLEITLEDGELCNLVEVIPSNHDSIEDFLTTLKYAYLFAKTITLTNTSWNDTNRVMLRNRRIGLSLTGLAQFEEKYGVNELKKWMEAGYETAKHYDVIYSDWFAIPQSIKITTVKPSGTLSLLAGVTPGIHYPQSQYYIRRIRLSNTSPYIPILKNSGYKIEKAFGQEDSTLVVEFPVSLGDNIRTLNNVSMWEQMNFAAFAQKYWSDNAVSVTVTFKKSEEKDLESALNLFQFQLKGVSFLPQLEEGAYPQMPYEEITKEEYEAMSNGLLPLDFSEMFSLESTGEKYCNNDSCSI